MHEELYKNFQNFILKAEKTGWGGRTAQAAPRGNAKSTLTTLILPLWCIAGRRRKFIGIISDTTEQAEEFLETIKAELEINERLREDFPDMCGAGRTWKAGQIVTKNGVKVKCWGKRKRLRGARYGSRRPDLMICDDLEDDENIDSPEQREKDRKWFFKAVMKIGARYTVFVVVGTILHYDSLLARLLIQPGWNAKKWKAVIKWSTSHLWEQWEEIYSRPSMGPSEGTVAQNDSLSTIGGEGGGEGDSEKQADAFFEKHKEEMLKGTQVLWPGGESYYYLMKMRVSDGPAFFDSEKQNEPINPDDRLFNEQWFQFWEQATPAGYGFLPKAHGPQQGGVEESSSSSLSPTGGEDAGEGEINYSPLTLSKDETVYCAVDPSMGRMSRKSDPSAIIIGVVRENGLIDILEADIKKRHPDRIMEDLFEYHKFYGLDSVVIEEVQFQELFKDQVIKEGARRGLYLPVQGVRPNTDKTLRISKLQPHIKNGLIRFRRNQRILLEQLKYFPKADHDDGPDALEMLFTLAAGNGGGPRIRRIG